MRPHPLLLAMLAAALPAAADPPGAWISVKDPPYSAKGDGKADDSGAIQAALDSGKRVFLPAGTYRVGASLRVPPGTLVAGEGKLRTTIRRASNADLISPLGAGSEIRDLVLDGNAAAFPAGRGIVIATGSGQQVLSNTTIRDFPGSCIEFAADGGFGFASFGGYYHTAGKPGVVAAVKVAGTDTQAIPRKFYATESGGSTLFDFGGCNNFFASGFYSNGLIFGASATKVMLNNMRIGAGGGVVVVAGGDHILSGISAVPVEVRATSSMVDVQAPDWSITDRGTGNSITIVSRPFIPTWTSEGAPPRLGNGLLHSRWSRHGNRVSVQVDLVIGTTTTLGSGTWEFTLPVPDNPYPPVQVCGVAFTANDDGSVGRTGVVRVEPGRQRVRILYEARGGGVGIFGASSPHGWPSGATLRFSCDYVTN